MQLKTMGVTHEAGELLPPSEAGRSTAAAARSSGEPLLRARRGLGSTLAGGADDVPAELPMAEK